MSALSALSPALWVCLHLSPAAYDPEWRRPKKGNINTESRLLKRTSGWLLATSQSPAGILLTGRAPSQLATRDTPLMPAGQLGGLELSMLVLPNTLRSA
jgi:hypothetical protein